MRQAEQILCLLAAAFFTAAYTRNLASGLAVLSILLFFNALLRKP